VVGREFDIALLEAFASVQDTSLRVL